MDMQNKRKIEVFSAGCPCCTNAVELVSKIAGPFSEIEVLDMHEESVARKASEYGVTSVPAVAVDGKLSGCCLTGGVDEATLRAAAIGATPATGND